MPLTAIQAGTDQLWSSSRVLVGNELAVIQCPGCREGQQPSVSGKSMASRTKEVITPPTLHLNRLHLKYCI